MGGKLFMPGGNPLIMFPGIYINLNLGTEKGEGGTPGSVVNHLGFVVNNVQERVAQWKAVGVPVLPGNNNRLDQAFVVTPDGVRIEILEDKTQSMPIRNEHVHLSLPEAEIPKAQAWYAKTFGGKMGTRNSAPVVDLPGVQLRFAAADARQTPTRGRVLDHIGFDVRDHAAFVRKIEAGRYPARRTCSQEHRRQHSHLHHRSLGYPDRDYPTGAVGAAGAIMTPALCRRENRRTR
jgi:hypothetical protein